MEQTGLFIEQDNISENQAELPVNAKLPYKKRVIKGYSSQKYREYGNGEVSKTFNSLDPNFDALVLEWREELKRLNAQWKLHEKESGMVRTRGSFKLPVDQVQNQQLPNIPTHASRTPFHLKLDGRTGNTTFLLGSSKSGKSTCLMKIYDDWYANHDFISILWTANPQIALYRGHRKLIRADVDKADEKMTRIIRVQKRIQTKTKNHYKFLNIFDDIINVRGDALLNELILTFRNAKMSTIMSLQYPSLMSKQCRANCNNILLFNFNTDESIEFVVKVYLKAWLAKLGLKSLSDQINWYKMMTRDHGFIYCKPSENHVSFHKLDV